MMVHDRCGGKDVVLDTNILIHSTNATSQWQGSSVEVLTWLNDSEGTVWLLDDQGKTAPDPRTSVLYKEYVDHLAPQSLPMIMLATFLQSGRVGWARRPAEQVRKQLRQLIPRNKADQAVAGAAHGSVAKLLISNDQTDFDSRTRATIRKVLQITIITSEEAVA